MLWGWVTYIVALHDCIILSLKYEKIKNHKMGKIMLSWAILLATLSNENLPKFSYN